MECPELRELAAYVETGVAEAGLEEHVRDCEACREAVETLEDEVMSLQISISELWFREHVSCPHRDILGRYARGELDAEAASYVRFHVEDLECAWCQARQAELEAGSTAEGRRRLAASRSRVGEATAVLIEGLKRERS
jgi:hypothetical protein